MKLENPLPIPPILIKLAEDIHKTHYSFFPPKLYVVGGAVRDHFFGRRDPSDWDLCITGFIDLEDASSFLLTRGPTHLAGRNMPVIRHKPTFLAIELGEDPDTIPWYEIALARGEVAPNYSPYDVVDFVFHDTTGQPVVIEDDLSRRDFTMNAMAWDILEEDLIDPYGGWGDIRMGTIKMVSAARFITSIERPLRVGALMSKGLRGTILDHPIEPDTNLLETCKEMGEHAGVGLTHHEAQRLNLNAVPPSQLWTQFTKAMDGEFTSFLEWLNTCGWLSHFSHLDELRNTPQDPKYHPEGNVWVHTIRTITWMTDYCDTNGIIGGRRYTLLLAALCHDLDKPIVTQIRNRETQDISEFDLASLNQFLNRPDYHPDKYDIISHGHDTGIRTTELLVSIGAPYSIRIRVVRLVQTHMSNQSFQDGWTRRKWTRLLRRLTPANWEYLSVLMLADTNGRGQKEHEIPVGFVNMQEASEAVETNASGKPESPFLGRHLIMWGLKSDVQGHNTPFWGSLEREDTILGMLFLAQQEGFFGDTNLPDPRKVEAWVRSMDWQKIKSALDHGVGGDRIVDVVGPHVNLEDLEELIDEFG